MLHSLHLLIRITSSRKALLLNTTETNFHWTYAVTLIFNEDSTSSSSISQPREIDRGVRCSEWDEYVFEEGDNYVGFWKRRFPCVFWLTEVKNGLPIFWARSQKASPKYIRRFLFEDCFSGSQYLFTPPKVTNV
jgi:hypothetical protein